MAVVGKTTEEIAARAELFKQLAIEQLWLPELTSLAISFRPETANILAEVYFALSEAYKRRRLAAGNRTEWIKSAALTAATLAVVNPLRPSGAAIDIRWPYINPSFAVLCAYGHARHMFRWMDFDEQRRFFSLRDLSLPSTDPIIAEGVANNGAFHSEWEVELADQEMSYLDLLVCYFALMREREELLLRAGPTSG